MLKPNQSLKGGRDIKKSGRPSKAHIGAAMVNRARNTGSAYKPSVTTKAKSSSTKKGKTHPFGGKFANHKYEKRDTK